MRPRWLASLLACLLGGSFKGPLELSLFSADSARYTHLHEHHPEPDAVDREDVRAERGGRADEGDDHLVMEVLDGDEVPYQTRVHRGRRGHRARHVAVVEARPAPAATAAAALQGFVDHDVPVAVTLPGGDLAITVEADFATAWMEGPVVEVFRGSASV